MSSLKLALTLMLSVFFPSLVSTTLYAQFPVVGISRINATDSDVEGQLDIFGQCNAPGVEPWDCGDFSFDMDPNSIVLNGFCELLSGQDGLATNITLFSGPNVANVTPNAGTTDFSICTNLSYLTRLAVTPLDDVGQSGFGFFEEGLSVNTEFQVGCRADGQNPGDTIYTRTTFYTLILAANGIEDDTSLFVFGGISVDNTVINISYSTEIAPDGWVVTGEFQAESEADPDAAPTIEFFNPEGFTSGQGLTTQWIVRDVVRKGEEFEVGLAASDLFGVDNFQVASPNGLLTISLSCDVVITDEFNNVTGMPNLPNGTGIPGDLNGDGEVDLLDVAPFVEAVLSGTFVAAADINGDGVVDLLDVAPFIALLI